MNANESVLVQDDIVAFKRFYRLEIRVLDSSVVLGLDLRLLKHLRCRTSDVEGSHRQLCARLTNTLRCDDAHRLTQFGFLIRREIQSVA